MQRGEQRFNINCAVCHGPLGAGDGIVKQYGLATVVTLQDDRLRNMADGEIFNTITHGKNTMMAYGPRVTVHDRWAIIVTCARCNGASTPARPMCRRNIRRIWRKKRSPQRPRNRRRNERPIPRHART